MFFTTSFAPSHTAMPRFTPLVDAWDQKQLKPPRFPFVAFCVFGSFWAPRPCHSAQARHSSSNRNLQMIEKKCCKFGNWQNKIQNWSLHHFDTNSSFVKKFLRHLINHHSRVDNFWLPSGRTASSECLPWKNWQLWWLCGYLWPLPKLRS